MLVAYGCEEQRLTETHTLNPKDQSLFWVDLMEPSPEEEKAVESQFGIDIPTREELAEIEVSSRLYQEDDATFMTVTIVHRGSDGTAETVPITFILKRSVLVTVRYAEPRAFPMFARQLQRPGQCPITGEAASIGLLEAIIDRAADHLEVTSNTLDQTSRKVFHPTRGAKRAPSSKPFESLITSIGEQGDFVSKMRESLVTLGRMMTYLTNTASSVRLAVKPDDRGGLKQFGETLRRLQIMQHF